MPPRHARCRRFAPAARCSSRLWNAVIAAGLLSLLAGTAAAAGPYIFIDSPADMAQNVPGSALPVDWHANPLDFGFCTGMCPDEVQLYVDGVVTTIDQTAGDCGP